MNPNPADRNGLANPEDPTCTVQGQLDDGAETQSVPPFPARIGRYRVVRILGEGGMGIVYEAEQDHPRRNVAIKVLRSGLPGPELLQRFELESQALGRLRHPGIAQVYEAGTADTGFGQQPYFAMELIRGESLLQYAEAYHLTIRQRLEIMVRICDAVQHAHQCGIIHRDLKPGNILVEENGQPKILDLGVARVTNTEAQVTRQTDIGQLVGTLAYMSPEQVLADPLELDTRSDVYALGVILFELLSGRLPYKISRQLTEAVQTIREEDPTPLSSISRTYRGDIETIVGKALAKEKARRYSSAADLGADIQRYLSDEPIAARPPSASYQLQKFARRNRGLVAGIAAVFVVLIAGIVMSAWQAARARRAEATANAVNDFLRKDLLAQANPKEQARPGRTPDPDLKVRTALDRAAARITGRFDKQPEVEASIRQTIGNVYRDLGLYPDARRQLERALELRRHALGEVDNQTLESKNALAELDWYAGRNEQAERLLTEVVRVRRRALGSEHPDTLTAMNDLASVYASQHKFAQAESLFLEVVKANHKLLGDEDPRTLESIGDLAALYLDEGRYAQAEPLLVKDLERRRRVLGEDHPETFVGMNNLAVLYRREGKYALAEPLYLHVLDGFRRTLGNEHPQTLTELNNVATLYLYEGKYAQAEPLFQQVIEASRRTLGEEDGLRLLSLTHLAKLYESEGRYAQAVPIYSKVLEIRKRILGPEHRDTLETLESLAEVRLEQRMYLDAERLSRESLKGFEKTLPDGWNRYHVEVMLAASLAGQKRFAEAEPLFLSGYNGMLRRVASIPVASRSELQTTRAWIAEFYANWGKADKAAEWRMKLEASSPAVPPRS